MGYILNDDQKSMVKAAKEFVEKKVQPVVAEYDREGTLPIELYQEAAELGYTALEVPEEYGGSGLDYYTILAMYEEFAKVDAGFATGVGAASLALKTVLIAGSPEQKKYFASFVNGEKQGLDKPETGYQGYAAFALTEAGAGSDAAQQKTVAEKDGDDYVINGSKCFITNASLASVFVVFATTDKTKGTKGISAFIVERDLPGVSIGKEEDKMGIRLSNTAEVLFDNVRVPADHLVGAEGKGFVYAMQTLDMARPSVASFAVGVGQRAIDEAVAYAKTRKTFGKPIIAHQAINFKLADMDIKVEAARSLVINYVNKYYEQIALGKRNFTREAAICKCFAGDVAVQVCLDAIQILGGYGYSREYPVEKLLRDAKIMQIYEGTNEVQRMVIGGALSR